MLFTLKNILRKLVCDILHIYRSDRIQTLQTNNHLLVVARRRSPRLASRSTWLAYQRYPIGVHVQYVQGAFMGYVDLKCYFEKDTKDSNHVFFYDEQLICLFHGTGNHWEKKNCHPTTQREWKNTTSDQHIKIIIGVSEKYSCCVRFVHMCTNNKLVQSLLELN